MSVTSRRPTRDPFRTAEPIGDPLEDELEQESEEEPRAPHRLTTYRPAGTSIPRYIGPVDRRKSTFRRWLWAIFHPGR